MNRTRNIKRALINKMLDSMSPLIRESLLDDAEFIEQYAIEPDAIITFSDFDVAVRRSNLYNEIRLMLSGKPTKPITDSQGRKWLLKNMVEESEVTLFEIVHGEQRVYLTDYSMLSDNPQKRLRFIDASASLIYLPPNIYENWRKRLSEHSLHDEEVDELQQDIHRTPGYKRQIIRDEFFNRRGVVKTLVPPWRSYYENLIGVYDGSQSIKDYTAGAGKKHLTQLQDWHPYNGFMFNLYLATHITLTSEIDVKSLTEDDLIRAYSFLAQNGDRISQLGAIEVGFRILQDRPVIKPFLIRIIKKIRDDDPNGSSSGFKLLSALFILIDGELSRIRVFADTPPFYRRLAALSQAALIHREFSGFNDVDGLYDWAFKARGMNHYLQSLTDLRLAPRWVPEYVTASQLKQEFIGRILIVADLYQKNLEDPELRALVLGEGDGSLISLAESVLPYLPGPLEGNDDAALVLPSELRDAIEQQLRQSNTSLSTFVSLVNSSLLFRVDTDQAELAAKVLELGNHRLLDVESNEQLTTMLNRLAFVAAISRSHSLADKVRILMRVYSKDAHYKMTIVEKIKICLMASGCHADLNDWRIFAGDWLTELAFDKLDGDEGKILLSHLEYLCKIVPELWATCGRAEAALRAYTAI